MKQCFLLYTWQLPEWDVTKKKRDPSKGPQGWGDDTWESLQTLYTKLEEKIGTLDVLWCFAEYEHWTGREIRRLWVLDVPSSEISPFLDCSIWEAMFEDAKNNRQPKDGCWDQLVVGRDEGMKRLSAGNDGNVTPLVQVPLSRSMRVVDHSRFNKGAGHGPQKYEDLPTSECEARKCREPGYKERHRKTRISRRSRPKKEEIGEN